MANTKMRGRILVEMIETLEGLHQSGALSTVDLWESLKNIENRTKNVKSVSATTSKQEKF
jgi:hypothetical protein